MTNASGKGSTSPKPSRHPAASLIGIVLIVVALPSLYLGTTMPGVMGYSLIALSIMALVAALGIGYNQLVKSKGESQIDLEASSESAFDLNQTVGPVSKPLSLSADVEAMVVFDTEYLLDTMDGDRDMVTMLLEVFVDEHLDDGHKIVKALQAGDLDQVQMISHSLKGVSASLGTEQIHALAEQIEHEVKTQANSEKLENLGELLKMVFTPAALAIQAFMDESAEIKSRQSTQEDSSLGEQSEEVSHHDEVSNDAANELNASKQEATIAAQPRIGEESVATLSCDWLDVNALREAMDGDEDTVCMLLEIFIEDNAGKGQVLVAAVSEPGQQDHALNIVHALKGVAANLSARPLRECCGVAEAKFKQNEPVSVEECRAIEQTLNQTIASAEAYLAKSAIGA
ncbi:Hpt domain-containing protein [Photobacterium sp. BZF1]|uniref:Hpt domain-containing protein n=1 Tax=Photobacterium sp. BZF1 TaxID=1904457 RepID=UPI001653AC52|nr:Hpt domain-containing protein [Photobacterium sp. BZF1]MBC7004970.1 Hpt domain-containing protein [Photobacterium sp. BZF1]